MGKARTLRVRAYSIDFYCFLDYLSRVKKSEIIFSIVAVPVDFVMLMLAGLAAYFLRTGVISVFRPVLFQINLPIERYILLVALVSAIFLLIYALAGLYHLRSTRSVIEEFSSVILSSSAAIMLVIVAIFLRQELFDSRFLVVAFWILAMLFVGIGRLAMRYIQKYVMTHHGFALHRVLLIGAGEISQRIAIEIEQNPVAGYVLVKNISEPDFLLMSDLVKRDAIDEVILANADLEHARSIELIDFLHEHHIGFRFVPNTFQTLTKNIEMTTFAGLPVVELHRTALHGWGQVFKRGLDVIGSLFGLIVLSPIFIAVAFSIKWETAGSVFVGLKRVSCRKHFRLYKFRSMIENAEELKPYLMQLNERVDSPLFKIRDDPRVTGIGRILRKYRLDELPQLWNVLKGDVSLVGPRPHQPDEIELYQKHHRRVLAIKAGVTGMAQISGSSDLPFDQEVALDSLYIENWTLWQDIRILILTVLKLFRDRSAV